MKRKRLLPKRLPEPQSMDSPEREYLRKINLYQRAYNRLVAQELNKILGNLQDVASEETPTLMRADSITLSEMRRIIIMHGQVHMDVNIERDVRLLFESVQKALMKLFPDSTLRKWAEQMASHVNQVSKKNTKRVGEAVDLDIEPLMKDGELSPYFKNVVDENVGLIRSISDAKIPAFKNFLVNAITNDSHNKDFWPKIQKYIDKNTMSVKAHAKLIARDQIGKLNGKLNQYRQQKIGGERYVWRTSKDERVRKDHKALDGKTCSWSKPPIVDRRSGRRGHPGYDFQCRCTAEMVLEDVID